ncbi:uncharacterized protein G2W53_039347 [Senna tora]|uniref:Uncharacterized protein n=1 Tax=Senna tora TaxID=362788 RepID=A0A834W616_9FABA|nr:uncharacterized protein G2W53_039347 [Senna tora]
MVAPSEEHLDGTMLKGIRETLRMLKNHHHQRCSFVDFIDNAPLNYLRGAEKSKKETEKGDRAADLEQTERELGDFRNLTEKKNGTERENRVEHRKRPWFLEKHRERGSSSIPLG